MRVLIETYNCTITLVPLAYCTISNKSILLVVYMGFNCVVHPIGVEPMTFGFRKPMLYPAELRVHLVGVVCLEESRTNVLNYVAS